MTNKSDNSTNSDVALLASWREWLSALEAEMSATNERDEKRRHVRVEAIQHTITETPSEGIRRHWRQACTRQFSRWLRRRRRIRGHPHIWTRLEC